MTRIASLHVQAAQQILRVVSGQVHQQLTASRGRLCPGRLSMEPMYLYSSAVECRCLRGPTHATGSRPLVVL